jgi:hypothetical protein
VAKTFTVTSRRTHFNFTIRNHPILAELGLLEEAWVDPYIFQSHFADDG